MVLVLLLLVYVFNFADRVLLGVMATPIKNDLGLTDTHLGLLGGTAFALFYATLGVPIAWLADRHSRSWIITMALVIWSGFTALCGFATNFLHLFLTRLCVGIGEAGGVAPSYSLISDYFPPEERARALGFYSFGIPIGSALGLAFGGLVASMLDWRVAFIAMGIAGVVIAPLFKALVRDPVRGGFEPHSSSQRPRFGEALRMLKSKPSFWLLSIGSALAATASYGISFWIPSFYVRSFGMSLADVSMAYAALVLVGGVSGAWAGAWITDRFGPSRPASYVLVPVCAMLISIPFYVAAVTVNSALYSLLLLLIPTTLGSMGYGPILSAIQHVSPPSLRTTSSAMFLLINNLIGLGLGSAVLGLISDAFVARFAEDSLRYALLAGTGFYVLSALSYVSASRLIARDWEIRR
ncbi:MAG: MFS transporter [Hyphomonadaceae bacterium]|nr:MFS transporter [Hyphomonadaceae bacterium]